MMNNGAKNHRHELVVVLYCICIAQGSSTTSITSTTSPCDTSGKCGAFGVCNSQDSPVCSCLPGFDPVDDEEWSRGNWSGGCRRRLPLNCSTQPNNKNGTGTTDDVFEMLQMMEVPSYTDLYPDLQQNECRGRCLSNCSCLAYGFILSYGCMFWTRALMDVRKYPTGLGSDFYVRLSNSEPDKYDSRLIRKKDSSMKKKIIIILVLVSFIIINSACTYISWKWRSAKKKRIKLEKAGVVDELISQVSVEELPMFKFEIVSNATSNFSEANKLGKGGFGPVYKGELANGREIAVKRLSSASGQGMQEFMNEVVLISKLQHRNLVRLIGCCVDCKERMLIYEYMPNKSLDFFLFDTSEEILDWRKRFKIIEGICRGLIYLHRDSRLKIIHRDLKPSNILLDNDWNPKISDFGMARIFGSKQDHVSTIRVVGTHGYMAPKYAIEGRFSEKTDVFSFGVVILEIVCGRRNTSFYNQEGPLNLLGHVWNMWNEDKVAGLVDSRISSSSYREEVKRCIHIGLLCVQEFPKDRPSVSAVLSMLMSSEALLMEPKKPAFSMNPGRCDNNNIGTSSSSQLSQKGASSINNVTLTTMVHGR